MRADHHVGVELLLDYVEGRAGSAARAQVEAHLDTGCDRCAQELAVWTRLIASLHAPQSPATPPEVVERAVGVFDRFARRPFRWEQVIARLIFDSRAGPVLAGARSAGGTSFQMLVEAGGTEVDLLCERGEEGWQVTGQALSPEAPEVGWTVSLSGPAGRAEAETNPRGEFRLAGLHPGSYEMSLRGTTREIIVREVRLEDSGH